MAERRMFAKSIIESDPFMDMPPEAQMLYIRLNMAADDDGFCDNPRAIMRSCGASNDSMKLLVAKKFVLTFEKQDNFIVVIKHRRMNNYIRKDNYRETKYKEFMRELYYDENRAYSLNPGDGHVPCLKEHAPAKLPSQPKSQPVDESYTDRIQTVDEPLTQDRIGKDRIGKDRREKGKDNNSLSDDDKRKERILFWKKRIDFLADQKYSTESMYAMAEAQDGITREEIDSYGGKDDVCSMPGL